MAPPCVWPLVSPSLGLWRKRVPCCGQPSWEKWIRVSLLLQSAVSFTGTGWDSHLTQLSLALTNSTLGVGVALVSITLLGENEARGLRSIRAGLERPMCHFPVSHFAKVQCAKRRGLRAAPRPAASGARHRSCQGAE